MCSPLPPPNDSDQASFEFFYTSFLISFVNCNGGSFTFQTQQSCLLCIFKLAATATLVLIVVYDRSNQLVSILRFLPIYIESESE